jgi:hypothetical protein
VKAPVPTKEDMQQMQPPKVIVPLPNTQVKEGLPVLLRATIVGKPTPNVRFIVYRRQFSFFIFHLVYVVQRWCTIDAIESASYSL